MDHQDQNKNALIEIDSLIVLGKFGEAQEALKKLVRNKPPRPLRAGIARLARRADLPMLSVRLLNPIVRVEGRKLSNEPTAVELAEYGYALNRLGAIDESIQILESIRTPEYPESLFLLGLAYISNWNYQKCIPIFKEYVFQRKITEYQRLVGSLNLASALIHEKTLDEAQAVLETVKAKSEKNGYELLLGKAYYFEAELNLLIEKSKVALSVLQKAWPLIQNAHQIDQILWRMWNAIARLRDSSDPKAIKDLNVVRIQASEIEAWEILRICDLYEGIFQDNKSLLTKLYFGTASVSFRKHLLDLYAKPLSIPTEFIWNLGRGKPKTIIDLENPEDKNGLKSGSSLHKLFHALTTDFYRTFRVAELHAHMYSEENYNPVSSPFKVKQGIKLLRKWLSDHRVPLKIEELNSRYRLSSGASVALRTRLTATLNRQEGALHILKECFPDGFSAREAAEKLEISHRTLLRILAVAVQENKLRKTGHSNAVRYTFSNGFLRKAA